MNHIQQKAKLESMLQSYKNFIPFCPNESLQKIFIEIDKIVTRLETISEMKCDELLKEVFVSYQEADSKINFINDI